MHQENDKHKYFFSQLVIQNSQYKGKYLLQLEQAFIGSITRTLKSKILIANRREISTIYNVMIQLPV